MNKKTVFLASILSACLVGQAKEWSFPSGGDPMLSVPHGPETFAADGVRAEVEFSVDLSKVSRTSHFANLLTKGRDFTGGLSLMVKENGSLLVDVKGIAPSYHFPAIRIESGRRYRLVTYVTRDNVRLFLDGVETESYAYAGSFDLSTTAPLVIGSMDGYVLPGSITYARFDPLSAVTVPPGGPARLHVDPPADQSRATVLWSRTICHEPDRYIGWPTVCRLKNGDILAVFSGDREEHICPWGKVQMVRSTDDGESWSESQTIANGPIDDRDAGIVQMPDGDLVVTWFTATAHRTKEYLTKKWTPKDPQYWWRRHDEKISDAARKAALGYFRMVSKDNGATWSEPMRMAGVGSAPHGPTRLKDGSLFQLGIRWLTRTKADGTTMPGTAVGAWKSTDKGATWQCLCDDIPWTGDEGLVYIDLDEPNAVELADGTLVGLVRYNGADHHLRQTVSKDGGRTWTPMARTEMKGLPPHTVRLADGRLVCVYGRRVPPFGEFACLSDDGGRTWDTANEIELRPHHNGDLGYPSSCVLANGDILTVYYQPRKAGEKPSLMATKWRAK